MNALKAFCCNRFDTRQAYAFGSPVARRTLTVVGAGDDDERLLALHVGFDRFPHAADFAFWLNAGERPGFEFAVDDDHFIFQGRVREGGALGSQMVATMGSVRIKVLFRQTHFCEIFTSGAVEHDGVGWREMIGGDVVAQYRQRHHAF